MLDAAAQDALDRSHQRSDLCRGECATCRHRVNAGTVERFVGVDVADAGYQPLVE
jgi:hypothetical protein